MFAGQNGGQVEDREVLAGGVVVGAGEDLERLVLGEFAVVFMEELPGLGPGRGIDPRGE